MRRFLIILAVCAPVGVLVAQLGTNNPTDDQINAIRVTEGGSSGSGIFDIAVPPAGTTYSPVERVPRDRYGVVGAFPLQLKDLDALTYPSATAAERQSMLEGMTFFTTAHPLYPDGSGPMANQPFCLGCHQSQNDTVAQAGVVSADTCVAGSTCVSIASRAARSTPTNFRYTSMNQTSPTGGGVPPGRVLPAPDGHPDPNDNLDALNGPGRTAAFTTFGDFAPNHADAASNPTGIGFFDPLDGIVDTTGALVGGTRNLVTGQLSQPFGGFVQHVRPSIKDCVPKPIPPVQFDTNLQGGRDPVTGLDLVTGFRRTVGERAGPPYIGRGLMEAIPTDDLMAMADPSDKQTSTSSLGQFAASMGCTGDCVAGKPNSIPRTLAVHKDAAGKVTSVTGFVGGIGRFGLRANGTEILMFVIGGAQGEVGITTQINPNEINFPTLFPPSGPTSEPINCQAQLSTGTAPAYGLGQPTPGSVPEAHLSSPVSERSFIRGVAPPEFGSDLLTVLKTPSATFPSYTVAAQVQRGAQLFGIDLTAFSNRMIAGQMPAGGDGLDPNAINQADRMVGCVSCHIPVQRTGQSPANSLASHLSFVWAPIFSDLLLHKMPVINAERFSPRPRDPILVARQSSSGQLFNTFDIPRSLADDTFSSAKASADGREFRAAPLMGVGRMGAPLLHDARVYLSKLTVNSRPAGTVTTNSMVTNAPLVVRTLEDALLAAIELHDLPAPDDANSSTATGGGCPVPDPSATNVVETAAVICPAYDSATSKANRSDSREVIRRFRSLSPADQQAIIAFLRQL